MAVPAFIGSNTQDSAGAQSLTFTLPTHTTDDLLVAFVKQSENTGQQTWDDDGGGGNGWTREVYNRTTSGRDQETAIYWKLATSASETNPTFTWNSGGTNEPMSGSVLVYRGVDTVEPFTQVTYAQSTNDANPPNPDVRIDYANTRVVAFHAATHDDISTVAAPTGFTLRTQVWSGTANDHRNHFTADIEIDTIGTYSPPDWQHSVLNTTPEYHTYTMAINEAQPIHITGGTALDDFIWGASNLTITGDGFEATQGTGKVEFWSDTSGTIKTTQTIDSWSDTSIQIDTVQGSLATDGVVYLVVTNDTGDESGKFAVNVGILSYEDLIATKSPDHLWTLDNTYNDEGVTGPTRNMTSGVVGTQVFVTTPLYEGATHSWEMNSVTDRREITDSANMNITISSQERTLMASVQLQGIQKSMSALWKEGGGVQNLAFLVGQGNVLMWQLADVAGTRDNVQAYSDFRLEAGRTYHITGRYSHLDTIKEANLYVDGIKQSVTDGNPMTLGIFDSHSGDVVWGDPDNNLEMGTVDIAFAGQEHAYMAGFITWSDNSAGTNAGGLTDAEIKQLAWRSFIPDVTIDSDTEANMQADVDLLADTVRSNAQLCIRVEGLSGGGDLELDFDNITFNPLATVQIQYVGADTLTVVKQNGTDFDTDKFDTPGGGTITVEEDVPVKVTVKDIDDSTVIQNARVLVEAASGGDLSTGVDILTGVTNASGVSEGTLRYTSDQPVEGKVRKTNPYYKDGQISATITSAGLDIEIFLIKDE